MDIKDVVLVATVREHTRNYALQVDAAKTPRRVEAAQTGKLVHPAVPTSGAVEAEVTRLQAEVARVAELRAQTAESEVDCFGWGSPPGIKT
jgi:hypothetical protein